MHDDIHCCCYFHCHTHFIGRVRYIVQHGLMYEPSSDVFFPPPFSPPLSRSIIYQITNAVDTNPDNNHMTITQCTDLPPDRLKPSSSHHHAGLGSEKKAAKGKKKKGSVQIISRLSFCYPFITPSNRLFGTNRASLGPSGLHQPPDS